MMIVWIVKELNNLMSSELAKAFINLIEVRVLGRCKSGMSTSLVEISCLLNTIR